MIIRSPRIPDDVFAALARGAGGAGAARVLGAVEDGKRLLLLRGVVERAEAVRHPAAGQAAGAYDRLAAMQRESPAAVDRVLRHPAVRAWARRTVIDLAKDARLARPGHLAALAAAAAVHAGARHSIEVTAYGPTLMLPSLGEVELGAEGLGNTTVVVSSGPRGAVVTSDRGQVVVPGDPYRDAERWRGLRTLAVRAGEAALTLVVDDVDPYRMTDMSSVADRLSAREFHTWWTYLDAAWRILTRCHWTTATEIRAVLNVLTPLKPPPRGQTSATDPHLFGAAALSRPSDGLAFALTLAHEVQHAKLVALLAAVPLTEPDDGRRYYAPWRDDPRPLGGLLHGAYAHAGVSGFWRRQRWREQGAAAERAHAEFARWRAAALATVRMMEATGGLTPSGVRFVRTLGGTLHAWNREWVPERAALLARRAAERHLADWQARNGAPEQLLR
ncbi:hypothetical protein Misp01_53120 [Microtetraspora sp. NBRC 13810]|uniref:HEXXH motif domain-containing protein n=1 Tax=Microtetraspora sp. NBRC 13810 TaxID=3030990 RepID=UPI0025549C6E|nr:HEXXH motif domain-containing protein [Microtetraspora sp. NBRC 13810]GLW10183.1 hypothetical protein Misp01_53120 [Microtetraspora sp. NBRC 13810]